MTQVWGLRIVTEIEWSWECYLCGASDSGKGQATVHECPAKPQGPVPVKDAAGNVIGSADVHESDQGLVVEAKLVQPSNYGHTKLPGLL